MAPKEKVLLNARAGVSWIYSNLLGKKANFELLHPTERKRAEEEYVAWTSYLLPIEEALSELETLKQEFIKLGDELEELKRYPTADEVCEALGEWIDENAMMTYSKVYYDDKKKSFEVGQYEPSVCYKDDEIIWFNWFRLPPHLITLIGRFYEGLEKAGKEE